MTPTELRTRIDRGDIPPLDPETYAAAYALARTARSESAHRLLRRGVGSGRRAARGRGFAAGLALAFLGAGSLWLVSTPAVF